MDYNDRKEPPDTKKQKKYRTEAQWENIETLAAAIGLFILLTWKMHRDSYFANNLFVWVVLIVDVLTIFLFWVLVKNPNTD